MRSVILFTFIIYSLTGFAQGADSTVQNAQGGTLNKDFRKSVYVSGNTLFGMNAGAMVNYEVPIFRNSRSRGVYGLVTSAGMWYNNWDWGPIVFLKFNYLIPWDEDYVEITLGGGAHTSPSIVDEALLRFYGGPLASVGYRYKVPEKPITYKFSIGIPEGLLLGVGINLN